LEYTDINGRILLKWILKKYIVSLWIGFKCLESESREGFLRTRGGNSGIYKRRAVRSTDTFLGVINLNI